MTRLYGSKTVSRAHLRTSLFAVLTMRERPLSDRDKDSLARSHGCAVADVEKVAAEIAGERKRRAG